MEAVSLTCKICHKVFTFELTGEQVAELRADEKHIQEILTNLTPGERELFISGICDTCFDEIFAEED